MCKTHPDRSAELFCSAHQELICILCGTTRHEACSGKKTVDDVADEKRAELRDRAAHMKNKGTEISKQVCAFQHCIVLVHKKVIRHLKASFLTVDEYLLDANARNLLILS
jgi:hypothetical protein